MTDGRDLDLSELPILRELVEKDRERGDGQVEEELRRLLRAEALTCYHITKETLHWGPTAEKIARRWRP